MIVLNTVFPVGHPYRLHEGIILPYVLESTEDGVLNVDGQSFLGVQLRRLDDVVDKYDIDSSEKIGWGEIKRYYKC